VGWQRVPEALVRIVVVRMVSLAVYAFIGRGAQLQLVYAFIGVARVV
jgi:hypothetical protein